VLNHCSFDYLENKLNKTKRCEKAATSRTAAVLLPIVPSEDDCLIIFTKRLRDLNSHGGEVSFPGGIMEKSDKDLMHTALRETHEEIGVEPSAVKIIGVLDDEVSKGGHRVTPYVGLLNNPVFTLQETEVERIYSVPVSHLSDPGVHYTETWVRDKQRRDVHFYRFENDIIWGLTAVILYKFFQRIKS